MSQVNTPLKVDLQTDWQVGLPRNAPPEAIEERGARFEKLMATSSIDNLIAKAQSASTSFIEKLPSAQQGGNTPPADEQNPAVSELLATVKKELSATEFKNLKEGWVGVNGTEYQFGQSYLLFMNEVVTQGTQIYNYFKDNLENP